MSKQILEVISQLKNMRHLSPATEIEVLNAQIDLGVNFADDYKQYVLAYGVITAKRVEITGVCESKRLNVVDVTISEREINPAIPSNMYVVESTGVEGLVILQNSEGEIFSLVAYGKPKKIFDSLAEYLEYLQQDCE